MKWVWIALAVLVAFVVLVGALLPVAHTAARRIRLAMPPAAVWALLTDVAAMPQWRELQSVELLPPRDGKRCWREVSGFGPIDLMALEEEPPHRLVTRIVTENSPFGGTWTFVLAPQGDGTELTITEHGEVYNPLFRVLSRFVFGHTATIDAHLRALAARCGAPAVPQPAEPSPPPRSHGPR